MLLSADKLSVKVVLKDSEALVFSILELCAPIYLARIVVFDTAFCVEHAKTMVCGWLCTHISLFVFV